MGGAITERRIGSIPTKLPRELRGRLRARLTVCKAVPGIGAKVPLELGRSCRDFPQSAAWIFSKGAEVGTLFLRDSVLESGHLCLAILEFNFFF